MAHVPCPRGSVTEAYLATSSIAPVGRGHGAISLGFLRPPTTRTIRELRPRRRRACLSSDEPSTGGALSAAPGERTGDPGAPLFDDPGPRPIPAKALTKTVPAPPLAWAHAARAVRAPACRG